MIGVLGSIPSFQKIHSLWKHCSLPRAMGGAMWHVTPNTVW